MVALLIVLKYLSFGIAGATMAVLLARLLFPLPTLAGRSLSSAIAPSVDTRIGAATLPLIAAHPGKSGIVALRQGPDAFATRYLLAETAERTIDARYYIWQKDLTGLMLLDALRRAAERGVCVRLLVDDNGIDGLDPQLAALDALPGMEVRLFNPFTFRRPKALSYAFDFPRLNRRMHNKSFVVDGAVAIVGGRNIGDVYFEHGAETHYFDLDVLAVGDAATDVSSDFDAYWNCGSSYPIGLFVRPPATGLSRLAADLDRTRQAPGAAVYSEAIRKSPFTQKLLDGRLPLEWVDTTLLSDDPAKGLGRLKDRSGLMVVQLTRILGRVERSIDLISAYFVPGKRLTQWLAAQARAGVRVRTLTNSLESTDVLLVHSGYVRHRGALLKAGVEMYEVKSGREEQGDTVPVSLIGSRPGARSGRRSRKEKRVEKRRRRHKRDEGGMDDFGLLGSSTTSLHAKSFAIDGKRAFIGSFNFDPRSALLNCEMGFMIDSPRIAAALSEQISTATATYRVLRQPQGGLAWIETDSEGHQFRYDTEPRTTLRWRILVHIVGWLPITWML